jgi:hypothetical protein
LYGKVLRWISFYLYNKSHNVLFSFFKSRRWLAKFLFFIKSKEKLYSSIHKSKKAKSFDLLGGNTIYKLFSNKYWAYKKGIFRMNVGFYFKIANKYLFRFYPIRLSKLYKSYSYDNSGDIYTQFNYIRFYSIYNRYLNYWKSGLVNYLIDSHEFKNRNIRYTSKNKFYCWS